MQANTQNALDQDEESTTDIETAQREYTDPVVEAYKKDVDRTLLRENLKLSVDERFAKFESFMDCLLEMREAGRRARQNG